MTDRLIIFSTAMSLLFWTAVRDGGHQLLNIGDFFYWAGKHGQQRCRARLKRIRKETP